MMNKNSSPAYLRASARVLGCLRKGTLEVIVLSGYRLADGGFCREIPIDIVPVDLRMPNSEIDFLIDAEHGAGLVVGISGNLNKKRMCHERQTTASGYSQ